MRDNEVDFQAIDIRAMSPECRDAVMQQATRRAHLERSRVFRHMAGRIRRRGLAWLRRLHPATGVRDGRRRPPARLERSL